MWMSTDMLSETLNPVANDAINPVHPDLCYGQA